ncbi:MAG: sodium:solute symporter, partial [Bacteroidota bacterium]
TMVIGSYFGEAGSSGYYWAILVFTGLTLAYTLKGGLRSSLLTDAIQMVLFGVLLFVILGLILPKAPGGLKAVMTSGEWKLSAGLNLFWVALIQVFSYPFHDSVMTDRGFISDPETIRKSFFWAGIIGALAIFLFSFVGVFAQLEGLSGQAPVAVSQYLGVGLMLIMNFIMITSAASTLDSAFSSFAKLAVLDLKLGSDRKVWTGRLVMILVCIAGTLPIFFNPEILSATTVSGTMVMGLAPVFLFWFFPSGRFSFLWSVGGGIVFGVLLTLGLWPESLTFFPGKYGDLLSVNLIGTLCCFGLFFLPHVFSNGTK